MVREKRFPTFFEDDFASANVAVQKALWDASREELRGSQGSGRGGVAGGRMEKLQAACGGAAESKDGGRLRDAKIERAGVKKKKKLRQRQFAV